MARTHVILVDDGISFRGWMVAKAARFLAPDFDSAGAFERAIAKDRGRGPSRPSRRLLERMEFSDECVGGDRLFRASIRGKPKSSVRILYLHGGAYILDFMPPQWLLAAGLLDRVGGQLVAPIYPLAPEHGWRETMDCLGRVYRLQVAEVGSANVILAGDSAGGGLALLFAQALRKAAEPLPAALVLYSPWLDLAVSGIDQPEIVKRAPILSIEFLRRAGRMWAGDLPANDPRVSPLFGDHQGLPPTIVFSGTLDVLDSDSLRLSEANPQIDLRHYRGMIHVWPAAPIPEARRALDEGAVFIKHHLPPRST